MQYEHARIAAHADLHPPLKRPRAMSRQVAREALELEVALSGQGIARQELGQLVYLPGPECHVHEWKALEHLLLDRLRPAPPDADRLIRAFQLQPFGFPQVRDEAAVGRLADRARVEQDQVGLRALGRLVIAQRLQHALHPLGVVLVHLTAERRHVVALLQRGRHRRHPMLGARSGSCGCLRPADVRANVTITADLVEAVVVSAVREALADADGRASAAENAREVNSQLERAQSALDATLRSFDGARLTNESGAVERLAELGRAREDAQGRVDQLEPQAAVTVNADADWGKLPLAGRHEHIRTTVESAVVAPVGRGAERITVHLVGQSPPSLGVENSLHLRLHVEPKIVDHRKISKVANWRPPAPKALPNSLFWTTKPDPDGYQDASSNLQRASEPTRRFRIWPAA